MNIYKSNNINTLIGGTIVTVGMFDGVHIGHQHILKTLTAAACQMDLRPVVVTFDQHPRSVLAKVHDSFRRISTNNERYEQIARFGVQDIFEIHFTPAIANLSACEFFETILINQLHAQALVLGYDNMFGNKQRNDFDKLVPLAQGKNISVIFDSALTIQGIEVSSTQIRKALAEGNVEMATKMMGRPYSVTGKVAHGRHVGHQIGFPTANIELNDSTKALPAEAVYAVKVTYKGKIYNGMANIGSQPTFDSLNPTFEVNIFDFEGDIYEQELEISFYQKLRPIQRFSSIDELVSQLEADRAHAQQTLAISRV